MIGLRTEVIVRALVLAMSLGWFAGAADAQDGDAAEGRRYAHAVCAECHAVERGEASPNPLSPSFAEIAAVPGMTRVALIVALRTPHRDMPDLVLDRDVLSDIAAYIVTLGPGG